MVLGRFGITVNGARGCPGGGFFFMMFFLLARWTHRKVLFPWKYFPVLHETRVHMAVLVVVMMAFPILFTRGRLQGVRRGNHWPTCCTAPADRLLLQCYFSLCGNTQALWSAPQDGFPDFQESVQTLFQQARAKSEELAALSSQVTPQWTPWGDGCRLEERGPLQPASRWGFRGSSLFLVIVKMFSPQPYR